MAGLSFANSTINLTASDDEIIYGFRFFFVKKGSEVSREMTMAYEAAKEKFAAPSLEVLTVEECVNLPKATLKEGKKIFIFDDFDMKNEAFNYIYNAKTVYILGTRCMLTVLLEGIATPGGIYHIYNLTMRDMVICTTSLPSQRKKKIKELVNRMGAHYTDNLNEATTHLVTESVRSVKYETATKHNIKLMHPDWVKSLWEKSLKTHDNFLATDEQFDRYKLPAFFNLNFTSTGLSLKARGDLKSLVEENGGKYIAAFNNQIDILILNKESIPNEKFKTAIKLKKFCLTPEWVFDSAEHGYAMPFQNYELQDEKTMKASTPSKSNCSRMTIHNPDQTELSEISSITLFNEGLNIDETASSRRMTLMPVATAPSRNGFVVGITLQAAKKVGNLLDGFNFYLSGFSLEEYQLLGKVLSILGGTKTDEINDQLTHVIVGDLDPQLFQDLQDHHCEPVILKIDWLKKVIEEKRLVDETPFEIEKPTAKKQRTLEKPSPASKKAMRSLSETFKKPEIPKFQLEAQAKVNNDEDMELVNQYLKPTTNPSNLNDESEDCSVIEQILVGKNVFVCSYDDSSFLIIEECEKRGGNLVDKSFKNVVDYVITPAELPSDFHPGVKYKEIVCDLWLEESIAAGKCLQVEFYHQPLVNVKESEKFLKNEIFVCTNYKGDARTYVEKAVYWLGGSYSDVLKRSDDPIIISPTAEGKKFESAKLWGLTVLTGEWLSVCLAKKHRVDEANYLVGDTNPSVKNIKRRESIVPSSQGIEDDSHFDINDPPVENFNEDVAGPSHVTPARAVPSRLIELSPGTPVLDLSISRLLEGMPSAQKKVTRAALLEGKAKNVVSPRVKRLQSLLNTPGTKARNSAEEVDSPMPALPACMRFPEKSYAPFKDSTPGAHWFHKRKFEAMDVNYIERAKRPKMLVEEEPIPYSHRRYDFFKARIPDYDSPDPRTQAYVEKQTNAERSATQTSKCLDFDNDDNSNVQKAASNPVTENDFTIRELREIEKAKPVEKTKKVNTLLKEFDEAQIGKRMIDNTPLLTEAMVEWKDDSLPRSRSSSTSSNRKDQSARKQFVFALNGMDDDKRKWATEVITRLGGKMDSQKYSHLLCVKPNKGEKFFTSLVCGRWILHFDYIEKCEEEGRFIDETHFEFGNPKMLDYLQAQITDEKLSKTPYNWRQWIHFEHKERFMDGAFTGVSFIFAINSAAKTDQLLNVIVAGGGKQVDIDFKVPLKPALLKRQKINVCFIQKPNIIPSENLAIIKSCKIDCLPISQIVEYLSSQVVPKPL